jgi:hypothetical protein
LRTWPRDSVAETMPPQGGGATRPIPCAVCIINHSDSWVEVIMTQSLRPPHGLPEIREVFGDLESYSIDNSHGNLVLSPEFEKRFIVRITLPGEIQQNTGIKSIRCHRMLSSTFTIIFDEIVARNLAAKVRSIDGCFVFRFKRSGKGYSAHSWGIAIDINAATNHPGTEGDMIIEIVDIFKTAGFSWGGDWKGKMRDPMHFQYCTGY